MSLVIEGGTADALVTENGSLPWLPILLAMSGWEDRVARQIRGAGVTIAQIQIAAVRCRLTKKKLFSTRSF